LHALAPQEASVGTLRETFVLNQLNRLTEGNFFLRPEIRLPKQGDFVFLDREVRYLFEVGGPDKGCKQTGRGERHYVVAHRERSVDAGNNSNFWNLLKVV